MRQNPPSVERPGHRLAETLGALSLATDLATGSPPETALGATIVAVRMGRLLELPDPGLEDIYYGSLTRFIGCTSTATEAAAIGLGDDRAATYAFNVCDWSDPGQVEAAMDAHLPRGVPEALRREVLAEIRASHEGIPGLAAAHCAQALALAARLPLPAGISDVLGHMYSRWDGKYPGARGPDIPLAARIIPLCVAAELHRRAGGSSSAVEMARVRSGGQFDPELCALVEHEAGALFGDLDGSSLWEPFLECEPGGTRRIEPGDVGSVAEVFADFADQKSGWWLGHSRRVASLASLGSQALGLRPSEQGELRLSALVHDIGRAAVPNGVWEKPRPLTTIERRLVESHSYQTETVLSLSPAFLPLAGLASSAYERRDGSGFHRHSRITDPRAGLLAAADVYDALTHDRPWRPAFERRVAAEELRAMVSAGSLRADCAQAVLEAAGHRRRAGEHVFPAGLTKREVEVLALLACGSQTKVIAQRLCISPKTADHHIQSVYEKTGARSRAAAALFAVEHGLLQE